MAKEAWSFLIHFRSWCYILVLFSTFSSVSFLYRSQCSSCCESDVPAEMQKQNQSINLLAFPFAWNQLNLDSQSPPASLKIALFVKKWPENNRAGGLERYALTLHHALARRGHDLHIFTTLPSNSSFANYPVSNMIFHLSKASAGGFLDQAEAWRQFQAENSTGRSFDVIHTESVGLTHTRSRNQSNVAVSWHGIAYESIHSDIIQELHRPRNISKSKLLTERVMKVIEEIKFFPNYAHHVATSDHAGDVLKRIYLIPDDRVHIVLNGVDQELFKPNAENGQRFRSEFGIPESKKLIIGLAGRLVKDKGHPLMFETLRQIFAENSTFRDSVTVVVVGDGPWGYRYKLLGSNLRVFGAMEQDQLADLYNAIDVFMNPTLRAQGLDHTLLEALLTGKPLMATKLASITESVIVNEELGYIFLPTVRSLKKALYKAYDDGREILQKKGQLAREKGLNLFTATKMASAYERLFFCISKDRKYSDHCNFQPQGFTTEFVNPTVSL